MPIRFQKWITRQDLRNNPKVVYVFGDNMQRHGLGGQAKEMRGEPNAIGVPTKWAPGWDEEDYFSDDSGDNTSCIPSIELDLHRIANLSGAGVTVVFPSDGLGTGLSMLPQKAPGIYKKLYDSVQEMCDETIPWEKPK